MCVIVDADVADVVFGAAANKPDAASEFLSQISSHGPVVVIGGRLKRKLSDRTNFRVWHRVASQSGHVHNVSDTDVDKEEAELLKSANCKSNDQHVLALARVSGAHLLYTADKDLLDDFRNRDLIQKPRGKVYKTPNNGKFTDDHRNLLLNCNCKVKRKPGPGQAKRNK